jgi:hypothetical protein
MVEGAVDQSRARLSIVSTIALATALAGAPACGSSRTPPPAETMALDAGNDSAGKATSLDAGADSTSDAASLGITTASDADTDALQNCIDLAIADAGPPSVCSAMAVTSATLQINNHCAEPVDLWWVNYTCSEVYYQTIQPAQSTQQSSWITHPWRVRLADAGALVQEIPPLGMATTVVDVP